MAKASKYVKELQTRIQDLEKMVSDIGSSIQDARKKRFGRRTQPLVLHGMSRALCIETIDPRGENRVRFYHPLLHHPDTPVKGLPFARPISSMGGFDDCGLSWVPPAGSSLCLIFENGNRESAYYMGTMWYRSRGTSGANLGGYGQFGYPIPEYDAVSKGHRGGYLVGPNDESQVLPPWSSESSNHNDLDSTREFFTNVDEQKRITYPNIYGFKTPEKHMLKMVDGNAKCNRRWKRMELMSGCGNWMIFKDDHLHYGGQWAHPDCGAKPGGDEVGLCSTHTGPLPYFTDPHGRPIEKGEECGTRCDGKSGDTSCSDILGGHPSTPTGTKYQDSNRGSNKYFKHENECRPYKGPGTPQNNRCDLPQSGVQILSIAGHSFVLDDSVEEPRGIPNWERSKENFDFGCNDKFLGQVYIKSATGHKFHASDIEEESNIRGEKNFIEMRSATGNFVQCNDHTIGEAGCKDCPPNQAGPKRGVHIGSTSKHEINLVDYTNQQCSPCRAEGGVPTNKATEAYLNVISGYGLEYRATDANSQQETQNQWIQITNPQCAGPQDQYCNKERGPHFLRFQGRRQGTPGVVFLRAGGHAVRSTYDMDIVLVGDKENNPSTKFTYVSKMNIRATEDVDFRYAGELHILFAEKQILLMAGRDCDPPPGKKCIGPCLYPVVVGRCPVTCPLTGIIHWTERSLSERVFASAKNIDCRTGEVIPPKGQLPPCTDDELIEATIDTGNGVITLGGGGGASSGSVSNSSSDNTTNTTDSVTSTTDANPATMLPPAVKQPTPSQFFED